MTLNASPAIISTVSRKPQKLPSPNDTPEKQTEHCQAPEHNRPTRKGKKKQQQT
jgi:hypothetical protein